MAESDSLLTQIGPSSLRSPAKGIFAESPGQQRRASLGLAGVSEDLVVCSPVSANALAVCWCWWETCRVRPGKTPKPL